MFTNTYSVSHKRIPTFMEYRQMVNNTKGQKVKEFGNVCRQSRFQTEH
jgi:hypothetical protein